MRTCIFIMAFTFFATLASVGYAAGEEIRTTLTYETATFKFAIPKGWEAKEIDPEAYQALQTFDDKLVRPPLGIVAADDSAGLMILLSKRTDRQNILFDYMLLKQWAEFEIYELFNGESKFVDINGTERECYLLINAVDDEKSTVLVSHNLIIFVDGIRYEFVYIADADEYAANFSNVDEILSSVEFY